MATEALIERILAASDGPSSSAIDALHELLDDAAIEASAMPVSVAEAAKLVGLSTHTLRTRMRLSGMTMTDLKRYILLVEQGPSTIPERRRIMLDQQDRITRQIRELGLTLETTEYKLRVYDGHPEG
jgi:DNA-binding transcriptional MerR regulator